jgi:tetratricopeptide (TPR) repeat protein
MIPRLICPKCGAEIARTDAYCPSCGEKMEWDSQRNIVCTLCGHANSPGSAVCSECGSALGEGSAKAAAPTKAVKGKKTSPEGAPLSFLQSWKLTAGVGLLLVATLIFLRLNRQGGSAEPAMPPQHDELVKEIESLQKMVDADPNNDDALIRLGNIYYDQRMFPRAIMMYERYLERNASNANARVDLGVSYFELALQDSVRRGEYFASAKKEIEEALKYAPKHQLAYYNLGMVNLHTGDIEKATEWFRKCYAIDSTTEAGQRAHQLVKNHVTAIPPS